MLPSRLCVFWAAWRALSSDSPPPPPPPLFIIFSSFFSPRYAWPPPPRESLFLQRLEREDGSISLAGEIIAGASAGFFQVIATNPMEIVKIRLQMQTSLPLAERQSMAEIVQHLGIRGMYRGSHTTLLRDVTFSAFFFPGYSNLKLATADKDGNNSIASTLFSGGFSAAVAAGAVTPADVLKTRLQTKGASTRYSGLADCFQKTAAEGYGSFYKGVGPRMMVSAPLFGIALIAFEIQKSYLAGA